MADDCVFHFGGDGPNSGDHKGREAIAAALIKNFELTAGKWALDIGGIYADDDHAAVVLHETASRPDGGRSSWTRCTSFAFATARWSNCGICPRTSRRTTTSSTGSSRRSSSRTGGAISFCAAATDWSVRSAFCAWVGRVFCASLRCAEIDAVTPGKPLADLSHLHPGAVGRDTHIDRERVQGPDLQVVTLPPDDLIEQPRIDTSPDHRRRSERVPAVVSWTLVWAVHSGK